MRSAIFWKSENTLEGAPLSETNTCRPNLSWNQLACNFSRYQIFFTCNCVTMVNIAKFMFKVKVSVRVKVCVRVGVLVRVKVRVRVKAMAKVMIKIMATYIITYIHCLFVQAGLLFGRQTMPM